jgi:hypothetical protein
MTVATRADSDAGAAGTPTPYLSVVATTRNDDHGGGMLARMQVFVAALVAQCERHGLDAELVLVEWNPPPERPRLVDAVRWPAGTGRLTVRIVEVPPEVHARLEHADRLPIFQMIAKNVGIRRAQGPFVLATNVDLLFSDGVMRTLASRSLRRGRVYRVDRHDVEAGVPAGAAVEEQLRWCGDHVLRINARRGTNDLTSGAFYPIYAGFFDLPRYAWRRLRAGGRRPGADAAAEPREPGSRLSELRRTALRMRIRPHTNACGDFTLMAREHWDSLRGYPELETYSLHIDSLLLYMSRHAGLREHVLDGPVFHVDHHTGFRPDDEGRRDLYAWLADAGIPWLTNRRFADYVVEMARTRRPLDLNDEGWGLAGESLPERAFVL